MASVNRQGRPNMKPIDNLVVGFLVLTMAGCSLAKPHTHDHRPTDVTDMVCEKALVATTYISNRSDIETFFIQSDLPTFQEIARRISPSTSIYRSAEAKQDAHGVFLKGTRKDGILLRIRAITDVQHNALARLCDIKDTNIYCLVVLRIEGSTTLSHDQLYQIDRSNGAPRVRACLQRYY
jgi:hypothetical protein